MKKLLFITLVLAFMASPVLFAETEDGGYAGAFLKVPVQARPAGMGGAYLGVSNDPAGQLYNPAGIQTMRKYMFTSSYRAMTLDRQLGFVSLILPTRLESSLGLSWLFAGYGDVEKRNGSGYLTGDILSSNEHAFAITFAKRFLPALAFGSKLNFYYKKHDELSANSVGINIGTMVYVDSLFRYGTMEGKMITDITGGFVISNVAAKYPWDSDGEGLTATKTDDLPIQIGLGGSCRMLKRKLLIAVDAEKNLEQGIVMRLGGEYTYNDLFELRTGLNDGAFTAGAGFGFELDQFLIDINYAFAGDQVGEGEDHIFTIDIKF